jgi:virginiamycin B lyase
VKCAGTAGSGFGATFRVGRDRGRAAVLGALLAFALALAAVPRAEAFVYWTNYGGGEGSTIGRASLDGSGANQSFIAGASGPCGVAVNDTHIFWANLGTGTIGRANLDGSNVDQSFISGASSPCMPAMDSTRVYWMNQGIGAIGRANLDGSGVDQAFIPGLGEPPLTDCGVAVNPTHIFWDNYNGGLGTGTTIGRANIGGTGVNQGFIGGATDPCGVAVNPSHVFWANLGADAIGRADLSGTSPDPSFLDANNPCGVAVDATHVYWVNQGAETIGRARLDGSAATPSVTSTGSVPCGVAVDQQLPPPVVGQSFNVKPLSGITGIKCEGDPDFQQLEVEQQASIGCLVRAVDGRVLLTSSRGTGGGTQSAEFYAGIFEVKQKSGAKPFTELKLAGSLGCGKGRRSTDADRNAAIAAKRKGRRLFGKGKGKFRSKGKRGAGSVRGTTWLVADRCDGSTLGKVKKGKIRFRDFVRNRTVTLRAGERYVAKKR